VIVGKDSGAIAESAKWVGVDGSGEFVAVGFRRPVRRVTTTLEQRRAKALAHS
jgi:hypothetical protein